MVLIFSCLYIVCFVFFKQKTAYEMRISDWSSDVCSSDLCTDRARKHRSAIIPTARLSGFGAMLVIVYAFINYLSVGIDGPKFSRKPLIQAAPPPCAGL